MVIVLVGQPSLSAADALAVGQHTGIVNTMRTYKDDEHGYEIDIPEDWSLHKDNAPILLTVLFRLVRGWTPHVNVAFIRGPNEILNIVIEPMTAEPSPEVSEHLFRLHAQQVGYVDLGFGRIIVKDKEHTWARYQFANKVRFKKYMISLRRERICNNRKLPKLRVVCSKRSGLGCNCGLVALTATHR